MKHRRSGFTLMEVMITVAIVAILAAVAIPTYKTYLQKGRRADAQGALLDAANKIDQYFTENNSYAAATLTNAGISATSPQGYYTLALSNLAATTFTITATPKTGTAQAGDACATITINELGVRGFTGTGVTKSDCWGS